MTTVPMNDLKRTYAAHAEGLDRAALEVLRSGWWLNGPRKQTFCEAFAASLGVRHCIGVGNGTDALEIALRALLARDARFGGDPATAEAAAEVVTVANAGGYATTACRLAGCVPVFCDIEQASQLMSVPSAVAALSDSTLCVVATHLYGGLVDVSALRRAMDEAGFRHVPILEDCAQAHGLAGPGGKAGAVGTIATFSFYPTKNLGALGDGGAVVTNDDGCAEQVRRLHQYGWGDKYRIDSAGGRNSRLSELQAAFLSELLPGLDAANARRVEVLEVYEAAAPAGVQMVRSPGGTVAHLAVVLADGRDALRERMHARGIATDIHYPVLDCDQAGWANLPQRVGPGGLDVSRASVGRLLTLPCFPTMTAEEVGRVCDALAGFAP